MKEKNLNASHFKRLKLNSYTGRKKIKLSFFKAILTHCAYQDQIVAVVKRMAYHKYKNLDELCRHCFEYPWLQGFLELYMIHVCEMDHKIIKERYYVRDNDEKYIYTMQKYLLQEHNMWKNYFYDIILKFSILSWSPFVLVFTYTFVRLL